MKLQDILDVSTWTPLSSVFDGDLERVAEVLYKIDSNFFVVAQPYNGSFIEGEDGPYITAFYWGANEEAVEYCLQYKSQLECGETNLAPSELLFGTEGTYGQLRKLSSSYEESAVYRASDGDFVHKKLTLNGCVYYFLKSDIDDDEVPYAIEVSLRS